jgi:hypothetical protein
VAAVVTSLDALVAEHVWTCRARPSQVEGKLVDGRWFYFRYRHGWASLGVGATLDEAIDDPSEAAIRYGGKDGGVVGEAEFRRLFEVLAHTPPSTVLGRHVTTRH